MFNFKEWNLFLKLLYIIFYGEVRYLMSFGDIGLIKLNYYYY